MNDKRKRAAPTIDLSATEVSSTPAENAPAPESQSPPPHENATQPQPEPTSQPPPSEQPHAKSDAPARGLSAGIYAAAIASGLAGAALVTAVFAALWYAGLLSMRPVQSNDAEIAALQKQVQELQNRPVPADDSQAVDALRQRVAKIERDIAKLPPGDKTVTERLAAADSAMKSLGVALAALTKRSDDIAAKADQAQEHAAAADKVVTELRTSVQDAAKNPAIAPAQLDALQKRVAALEQSVKAVRTQIVKVSATDTAARLALSAASLRDAVESGAPYQAELAQAKSLGANDSVLAPLDAFAASGVPANAALAQQLTALIPAMLKAAGAQKAPSGFLERLQANAGSLVRIGPINAPAGDSPSDVLARIEGAAAHADINGALADLGKLPEPARAPAQAWIAKAKARQQALAAARAFAADAASKLGKR
jgi:hypothetical protein